MKKAKLPMKALSIDCIDQISIVFFLATFELAYDTHEIHKGFAMWVLPQYVNETTASILSSSMCAAEHRTESKMCAADHSIESNMCAEYRIVPLTAVGAL